MNLMVCWRGVKAFLRSDSGQAGNYMILCDCTSRCCPIVALPGPARWGSAGTIGFCVSEVYVTFVDEQATAGAEIQLARIQCRCAAGASGHEVDDMPCRGCQ